MVDSEKRTHVMMGSTHCPPEGIFLAAKKGQTFNRYSEETKKEAVRLYLEEGFSYVQIQNQLGIKSSTQIINWINRHNSGESFEDYRGRWNKKHFSSHEEENMYLKAQIDYLKKQNPNLHGEGCWEKNKDSK
jgi:transposase-like protein